MRGLIISASVCELVCPRSKRTRSPAVARMADRTALS